MPIMSGFKEVARLLLDIAHRDEPKVSVSVGYTAMYALWVHEAPMVLAGQRRPGKSRGYYWDPQGRATNKFLEGPAREFEQVIGNIVRKAYSRGATLEQSLVMGGLRLQRESQKRAPVDVGNLKASAFTRVD